MNECLDEMPVERKVLHAYGVLHQTISELEFLLNNECVKDCDLRQLLVGMNEADSALFDFISELIERGL